jgi:hypothetical protein
MLINDDNNLLRPHNMLEIDEEDIDQGSLSQDTINNLLDDNQNVGVKPEKKR